MLTSMKLVVLRRCRVRGPEVKSCTSSHDRLGGCPGPQARPSARRLDTMKSLYSLAAATRIMAGCTSQAPAPAPPPAAPVMQPYASLAQVMRGIPFPNSNIIFDTQTNDPGAAKKPGESGAGASASAQ